MPSINSETMLCISIAARPSNLGATIMNACFEQLKLNFAYKPFTVAPENLRAAVAGVRAFGIRGCGVSMPHKTPIMALLDKIDTKALQIGAVNTVVNDKGMLTGYNTDYVGAMHSLNEVRAKWKSVLIFGAGGAARAIIVAAKECGAGSIAICARNDAQAKELSQKFKCVHVPYATLASARADIFFNATPLGMAPKISEMPLDASLLSNYSAVCDVVVNPPESMLVAQAKKRGLPAIPGYRMAMRQSMAQFRLYTGHDAPEALVTKKVLEYGVNSK